MKKAILQAEVAKNKDEVPIGCVIVKEGKIIARGHNMREKTQDATYHAEIIAIKKACKKLETFRLTGCTIYVTVEPCTMCAGAIINSRISRLVFGTYEKKSGAVQSVVQIFDNKKLNHHCEVLGGVLKNECADLLTEFFREKR